MLASKRMLYLEGASGISGDMTVAALLDLGASQEKLEAALESLRLEGYDCVVSRKSSYGLDGVDFDVRLHDYDHEHDHDHEHEHEHDGAGHHHHEHRNLSDVYEVIDRGVMTDGARALAKRIFLIVAEAEAAAHGVPLEQVHFHEVGAIDSIVDVVSAAVLVDDLDIDECVVDGLTEGRGFVCCQHGELPVPVPAVLNVARAFSIPLRRADVQGEMVTPTGIGIAAALRTRDSLPGKYRVEGVGVGLGKRDFGRANFLRAMILVEAEAGAEACPSDEKVWILECNIDDSTGEMLGLALERLMEAGARDAHFTPCFMKKNRPAYLLRVIADEERIGELEEVIFDATTTIGIRRYRVERSCMQRAMAEVETPFGQVAVKVCAGAGVRRCYPEFESVKRLSDASGVDFQTIFRLAQDAANEAFSE